MIVVNELNSIEINYEIGKAISKTSTVMTDGYRSYSRVNKVVDKHIQMVVPSKEADKKLPGFLQ